MIEIKKIRLKELLDFTKSELFINLEHKPISSARVLSYINNPNADENDIILFMAFKNNKLVGYRTIWRDTFHIDNNEQTFGWLSGNWVHTKNRREGISTQLFNEVYKNWDKKLMYTNYAVASKLVYDKTNCFEEINSLVGTRFYVRFCFADILPNKKKLFQKMKFLWFIIDAFGNLFLSAKKPFIKTEKIDIKIKKNEPWNNELQVFLENYKRNELFKRDQLDYDWIKNFPWVKLDKKSKSESKSYYFSLSAKSFHNDYYTFYKDDVLKGFLWLTVKNKHFKVTYSYLDEKILNEVTNFIIDKIFKENIKTVLVYDKNIEKRLKHNLSYVYQKEFYQKFFATKTLVKPNPEMNIKKVNSGDGDVIFT